MNQRPETNEPTELRQFLPSTTTLTTSASTDRHGGLFAPQELAAARQAQIRRRTSQGWTVSANGTLVRGAGAKKVETRPTEMVPSKSGDVDFNPSQDAFALRLGAVFVGPNRYRMGDLLLDANGACRDEDTECPECGSVNGEYRFFVRVEGESAKPWESAYACCTRCCTLEEMAQVNGA